VDRPLARDEQLSSARRYPGADEALEPHRDEQRADPVKRLDKVARVVQARATNMLQPVGFPEDTAGLLVASDERGDRIASSKSAANDLATDVAGGADYRGGHRVFFR
jgi:hypothetical protein